MLRSGKLATPLTAAWVLVPESAPPPGLVPIAIATVPAKLVAVLPRLSRAVTCTAGVIVAPADAALGCTVPRAAGVLMAPAVALLGCTVKASCVAEAGVTVTVAV